MKTKRIFALATIFLIASSSAGIGQHARDSWSGKHNFQLNIGLLSDYGVDSKASAEGVTSNVGGGGFWGSVAYNYWLNEQMAIGFSMGVVGSEVNTAATRSRFSAETGTVVSLLLGVKYQPIGMRLSENVRPNLFAAVGPCIGAATTSGLIGSSTYTETAMGLRVGVGIDFALSDRFMAGVSTSYFLASDFDRPIGSQTNSSSPEFGLSFGILLGGKTNNKPN